MSGPKNNAAALTPAPYKAEAVKPSETVDDKNSCITLRTQNSGNYGIFLIMDPKLWGSMLYSL